MPDVSFDNLFLVVLVGAAAPLALGFAPRLRLPSVVLELVAGIVLGPAVLGWLEVDLPVQVLSLIGLAFLLFLSGLEIDVRRLRGALLRGAVLGYLVTLALGIPIGLTLDAAGWVSSPVLVVIALSATSLGLVVLIWISTAALQAPCHQTLSQGFDAAVDRRLTTTNWIRTAAWTIRALMLTASLLDALR